MLPRVYLARHGETAWTLSGQHTGRTDIPLTPRGEADARHLGERLKGHSFAVVLTSPLQRAKRTCELAGFGDRCQVDAGLREWDYGEFEGLKTAEIRQRRPDWDLFRDGCPGGEDAAAVGARADRVLARVRAAAGDVLLFAHGHILRVITARWLGQPPAAGRLYLCDPTSLGTLGYEHDHADEPVLRLWNEAPG
ncbi:MAG TPA: histidine phosphatase family protein [Gemmataceae bacterium]|jgi:probable phosphoglycerate mutase